MALIDLMKERRLPYDHVLPGRIELVIGLAPVITLALASGGLESAHETEENSAERIRSAIQAGRVHAAIADARRAVRSIAPIAASAAFCGPRGFTGGRDILRVNFYQPSNTINSAQFGRSTQTFDAREIQFGLKFIF